MGDHFNGLNMDVNQPCKDVIPYQVLYKEGRLNGFVFTVTANMTDPRSD